MDVRVEKFRGRGLFVAPLLLGLLPLLGASCVASSPIDSSSSENEQASEGEDALSGSDAISRAEEWVNVKLHYCQAPNHHQDFDSACSSVCNRHDNAKWNPYRSDCSGLVSWAWGLAAPGRTTLGFAPFEDDITKKISATDLEPGDAINNSEHVMLFKRWVTKNHRAVFIEEPGCSSATPYAHEVTTDVSVSGSNIHVSWNGMNFTAIRYKGLHKDADKPAEPKMRSDRVGVSSWASGRLDLFARDEHDALQHKYWSDSKWSHWQSLGGKLASAPAAVSWAEHRIDVFAQNDDGHLVHKWWTDGAWSHWEDLGGKLTSAPTVVSLEARSLDIFARGADDHLVHRYFRPDTGWSAHWEDLGGDLASTPSAVTWQTSGRIDVFGRDKQDNVAHIYFQKDPHGWSDWHAIHGPISNGPMASSWGEGRIDLFGTDSHGALRHRYYDDGAWSDDWQNLGGTLVSAPTGVSWGDGRIDVFARGGSDILVHKYFSSHHWADWKHESSMPK